MYHRWRLGGRFRVGALACRQKLNSTRVCLLISQGLVEEVGSVRIAFVGQPLAKAGDGYQVHFSEAMVRTLRQRPR